LTPALLIEIPWDPNITTLGGLLLTWHGLFTAVGILIGVQIALRVARATGVDEDDMYTLALVAVPAGIVGARGLYVIEHWDFFGDNPGEIIAITEGGISVWGALVTGVLGSVAFAVWRRYEIRPALDAAIFGMLPGLAIGRLGDLVNGEHLARGTDLPWAVVYTDPDSPAFAHSIAIGSHHPATTYELILAFVAVAALVPLFLRWSYRFPGVTFMLGAASYALIRFALTYTRLDSSEVVLGLRVPQLVAVLTLLVAIAVAAYWLRLGPDEERPEPIPPGRIPIRRAET
jgi:phosphatidylglycerol:prolipoprotein diacylglycerol transferase